MEIIHEPHDSLFKLVFSIPQHTRAELLAVLPPALVEAMDLATLQPLPGSFVDPEFHKAFTDLLFSVVIRGHEARISWTSRARPGTSQAFSTTSSRGLATTSMI